MRYSLRLSTSDDRQILCRTALTFDLTISTTWSGVSRGHSSVHMTGSIYSTQFSIMGEERRGMGWGSQIIYFTTMIDTYMEEG
jgi:hypothetical protein